MSEVTNQIPDGEITGLASQYKEMKDQAEKDEKDREAKALARVEADKKKNKDVLAKKLKDEED